MPIRPELRHFYRGPEWRATRERIRERAGDRCEQCGKPNRKVVSTYTGRNLLDVPRMFWQFGRGRWRDENGREVRVTTKWNASAHAANVGVGMIYVSGGKPARRIRAACTVAHLNHTPGDDRDENLKFLCQWCHLNYDKLHHKETRSVRKDAARPLLKEAV